MLSGICALLAGIGMPMQTSINAQLGKRAGSPFLAALINFTVGIIVLCIAALFMEGSLAIPFGKIFEGPCWIMFGGAFAVVFVVGNVLLMPRLGSIQTAILPALGQIIMGTMIDTFGIFGANERQMTPLRFIGMVLVFAGVVTIIRSKNRNALKIDSQVSNVWIWRAFGIIMGCCMACQTAVNSNLGVVIDSRIFASIVNFLVGIILLILLNAGILAAGQKKPGIREGKTPKWIFCGGLIGAWYCIGNIITAQAVGTGMAVIILLTGLMIGGLLVDQFGMFRAAKRPVHGIEILGVLIMIGGAAMFHLL